MTDRICGFTVTLDRDIREDDAETLLQAIAMLRGVASVSTVTNTPMQTIAVSRAKNEIKQNILAMLTMS